MAQDLFASRSLATEDERDVLSAGENAKGEYHCADCGYGVTVYRTLPVCPMCSGESWEHTAWSPFRLGAEPERRLFAE